MLERIMFEQILRYLYLYYDKQLASLARQSIEL